MALEVIGAGWGRTATKSLKMALEQLGYGTVHHMHEVLLEPERLIGQWNDALDGAPDWDAIFAGNRAACDWPTAAFWSDLASVNPEARFILTTRSPESWHASISETILQVLADPTAVPPPMVPFATMARRAVVRSVGDDWSCEALIERFKAHETDVRATIPASRLLVLDPSDGWEPLCAFLDKAVPDEPFPRSNNRIEFFETLANPG
jgi:hypothetical protein